MPPGVVRGPGTRFGLFLSLWAQTSQMTPVAGKSSRTAHFKRHDLAWDLRQDSVENPGVYNVDCVQESSVWIPALSAVGAGFAIGLAAIGAPVV